MSKWNLFLEYAKAHPDVIPRNAKRRSEIYHQFLESCRCNDSHIVCKTMRISSVMPKNQNITNDVVFLQAKAKAYEELLEDKDAYIKQLERFITKKLKTPHRSVNSA